MKQDDLEKQIEETLNSLYYIQRVDASPFLYENVMKRLKTHRRSGHWVGITFAGLILSVMLGVSYLIYRPHSNPEPGFCYESMFNPATVTDVEGTVGAIAQNPEFPPVMRMELKTKKGTVPVLLSPEGYLQKNNFTIEAGDRIALHGSKVSYEGHNILVAGSMEKNGTSIAFRAGQGSILWNKNCVK